MSLQVVIVTPERTLLNETADAAVVPLFDGEKGVLPGHARTIGRLGFGELRFQSGGSTTRYYIDGGFVQIANNEVNILTGRAVPASDIDRAEVERQLAESEKMQPENREQAANKARFIEQARAQLRVASSR